MQFKCLYSLIVKRFLFQAIQFRQAVLIQTIQFSISMQLVLFNRSIGPYQVATIPSQSGPGSNGNEGVLCIPQSFRITGSYPSTEVQSVYSTAPANWAT